MCISATEKVLPREVMVQGRIMQATSYEDHQNIESSKSTGENNILHYFMAAAVAGRVGDTLMHLSTVVCHWFR